MRSILLAVVMCLNPAFPLFAQNTDIESLSGLQFNFGNPGARSLGMGGAFLGLADDASAAESNPAGLTILRKPEVSIEFHNFKEQQMFTTTGTYPDIQRTAFSHYGHRLSFASFVIPIKSLTIGAYFHEPLHNQGSGQVAPVVNKLSGQIVTDVPAFYLPTTAGGPVSKSECAAIDQKANDPFACLEYTILPFLSQLTVQERTFGLSAAYEIGHLSGGVTVRRQKFDESAFTFRPEFPPSIAVQATSDITGSNGNAKDVSAITLTGGMKWTINNNVSVGGVYKQGAKFNTEIFEATADTANQFVKVGDTTFHVPDVYGVGVSVSPIPVLKVNADAVRVAYSNLVDDFVSINADIRSLDKAYKANDVTELHVGAEYFFLMKVPVAIRAGVWRDPAHSIEYRGPLDKGEVRARAAEVADAILYPKGSAQRHISLGAGLAWPQFSIDAAFDYSRRYQVGSISAVARF